jgi:hypothetical protein
MFAMQSQIIIMKNITDKYRIYAVYTYVLATGFLVEISGLPKIRLPEIIFLFLLLPCTFFYRFNRNSSTFLFKLNRVDFSVIAYAVTVIISNIVNGNKNSILLLSIPIYLILVYFVFKWIIIRSNDFKLEINRILKCVVLLGAIQCISGVLGVLFWFFSDKGNILIQERESFVYFGALVRIQGFTDDPNMLSSILWLSCISILFLYLSKKRVNYSKYLLMFSLLIFGFVLTLSKTVLLSIGLILMLIVVKNKAEMSKKSRMVLSFSSLMSIFLLLFITHFYVTTKKIDPIHFNRGGSFINEHSIYNFGDLKIFETSYSINKKVSLLLFENYFPWGCGIEQQMKLCLNYRKEGIYPKSFGYLDSHCSYTGIFAESGLFGGLGYLFMIITLFSTAYEYSQKNTLNKQYAYFFLLIILGVALEAIILETNNFRHQWIMLGLFSGFLSKSDYTNQSLIE